MEARLIKTTDQYEKALKRIEDLMDAEAGTGEAEELELLSTLVSLYEDNAFPIPAPSPAEAIRFRMEQLGLSRKDLAPYMGGANRVSEVLSGKRALTVAMIRNLVKGLGIPAEVLL